MKYLTFALALLIIVSLSVLSHAGETYSLKATTKCQLFIEVAAYNKGYSFAAHKVKGANYISRGNYAEFIVSLEGELAKVQCQTDYKGEIMYLKLGETVVVGF